ncbi:MAG: hypothetical protein ACR2NR_09655 [Solirubrobacteraceae bacterium]
MKEIPTRFVESRGKAAQRTRPSRHAGTRGMPRSLREQLILGVAGQVFAQGSYDRA